MRERERERERERWCMGGAFASVVCWGEKADLAEHAQLKITLLKEEMQQTLWDKMNPFK
jgi:hypothetical protein